MKEVFDEVGRISDERVAWRVAEETDKLETRAHALKKALRDLQNLQESHDGFATERTDTYRISRELKSVNERIKNITEDVIHKEHMRKIGEAIINLSEMLIEDHTNENRDFRENPVETSRKQENL